MKREKELRLALVLYGGVSLAIYMFGVSREVQKLVRASRLYFSEPDPNKRDTAPFPDLTGEPRRETDSEHVYFELLKALNDHCGIRVVCDVVSGASAGGINGMFLSRALAHDLPLDPLRELWLSNADVMELADDNARQSRWVKSVINPVLRQVMTGRMDFGGNDPETRAKLVQFMNLRWFKPPFSGSKFIGWMLDACDSMDAFGTGASLLPNGHPLDLFLSLTDFNGHPSQLILHDPPQIEEREHRFPLSFRYRRGAETINDNFGSDSVPGLVFAARATSSFPGAFPPATIKELETELEKRGRGWPAREQFVAQNFGVSDTAGRPIEFIPFIDGSVVNNKPFGAAIDALGRRPANREVVRRVVYVDPDPGHRQIHNAQINHQPGFFRAIFSSLSEIPRNEPIVDDLEVVSEHNRRVQLVSSVIDAAVPQIGPMVDAILDGEDTEAPTMQVIASWRDRANTGAAARSGFAFQSYIRLKTLLVLQRFNDLCAALTGSAAPQINAHVIDDILEKKSANRAAPEAAVDFLRHFDIDFRIRRLRFVIYRLNALYGTNNGISDSERVNSDLLDEVKNELYKLLDEARDLLKPETHDEEMRDLAARYLERGDIPDADGAEEDIAAKLGLADIDARTDELFSVMVLNYLPEWARHPLIVAYVGFPFFDVLTLPMTQKADLEELDAILIDRISPVDACFVDGESAENRLKGNAMHHFGAFFNRRWRENDYLWGRLTSAERLVDILIGAVDPPDFDATPFKRRLFASILDAEEPHLKADPDLIPNIRAALLGG